MRGVHHVAYRCVDAATTTKFYEELIGLRLAHTIVQDRVPSTQELAPHAHIFFDLGGDGDYLAFFDVGTEDRLPQQDDPDWAQHLAIELDTLDQQDAAMARLEGAGIDVLGPVDHGFIRSIYFYDPSGHRMELTVRTESPGQLEGYAAEAHKRLDEWQAYKQ